MATAPPREVSATHTCATADHATRTTHTPSRAPRDGVATVVVAMIAMDERESGWCILRHVESSVRLLSCRTSHGDSQLHVFFHRMS
jgi:hypothetical protein